MLFLSPADGKFVICLAQVAPGNQAFGMSPTDDGLGRNDPLFFTRLKSDGLLKAPVFQGEPQVGMQLRVREFMPKAVFFEGRLVTMHDEMDCRKHPSLKESLR